MADNDDEFAVRFEAEFGAEFDEGLVDRVTEDVAADRPAEEPPNAAGEQPWARVSYKSADFKAPPNMYAVPASAMPLLQEGTWVTYGRPGCWVIDELYIAGSPSGSGDEERYPVLPFLFVGWKSTDGRDLPAAWMRTRDLWVYRLGAEQPSTDVPDLDPSTWYRRMPPAADVPPPVRRPRPARELPSLTGQAVWFREDSGRWASGNAVTEPVDVGGDIEVGVMTPVGWSALLRGEMPRPGLPVRVPLHRLWAY